VSKPNGAVIYRGPSQIDGKPIVAIATGLAHASANPKTGDMVQTWILREDVPPLEAGKTGEDASICGGCKHRPTAGGTCYVSIFQGPRSVWAAYKRESYPILAPEDAAQLVAGRKVRLGAYGDPCAVPLQVWRAFIAQASGHTGYTHQWRGRCAEGFQSLIQASVDTEREHTAARAKGWATFRVRSASDPILAGEFVCPASDEGGHVATCETCGACNGRGAQVVIVVHGARSARFGQGTQRRGDK